MFKQKWLYLFFLISLMLPIKGFAQADRDFIIATQLIRLQDFERAQTILEGLLKKEPQNRQYLQQATNCYINLKEYKKGIGLLEKPESNIQSDLGLQNSLALLYHYQTDTLKAYSLWNKLLAQNSQNMMVYQIVGSSLVDRREFIKAGEVYQKGRKQFNNAFLFLNELAFAYLQSNEYEKAAKELLTIIDANPKQTQMVQRQFARYNDPLLYNEAVVLLEEAKLENTSEKNPANFSKKELLLWLYNELGLERKAIKWAEMLEKQHPDEYYVYNLAQNFIRKESFESAEKALDFYLNQTHEFMRPFALDVKAELYLKWGNKLVEQGLSVLGKSDTYYKTAAGYWEEIIKENTDYDGYDKVLTQLLDLYLDHLAEPEKARNLFKSYLKTSKQPLMPDETAFYEGRFALLEGQFRQARMLLTEANTKSKNAAMLEKSRYFLALNDFYTGDFEFAKIQLKAVERQPSSFYANDAIKLHNQIRKGMEKDSVLPEMNIFSQAAFAFARNEFKASFDVLSSKFDQLHDLQDEAALLIVEIYRKTEPETAYNWLKNYPEIEQSEVLYFNQASLAYLLFNEQKMDFNQAETQLKGYITRYPNGFFADQIRELLQEMLSRAAS